MADTAETNLPWSRQVLEETPERVTTFLGAVYRTREIRAALEARGYTPAVHKEGWRRLHKVLGFREGDPEPEIDPAIRDATITIDKWDEPNFVIARASLRQKHPEQVKFIFENLEASTGAGAVGGVAVFLSRVDELAKGRSPETRAEDQAAVKLLAARGIDEAERKRVAQLVSIAQGVGSVPDESAPAPDPTPDLVALKEWYEEWSEIARVVITKRLYLIRLGLAKRRAAEKKAPGDAPAPA